MNIIQSPKRYYRTNITREKKLRIVNKRKSTKRSRKRNAVTHKLCIPQWMKNCISLPLSPTKREDVRFFPSTFLVSFVEQNLSRNPSSTRKSHLSFYAFFDSSHKNKSREKKNVPYHALTLWRIIGGLWQSATKWTSIIYALNIEKVCSCLLRQTCCEKWRRSNIFTLRWS